MAKTVSKLTDLQVRKATTPGLYPDGAGLYLQVSRSSAKSWIFRFTLGGKSREMGLGSASVVPLARARELVLEARRGLRDGVDPIEARKADRRQSEVSVITFMECAEKYIAAHSKEWRNAKHAAQWQSTLKRYVEPVVGKKPIQGIDTDVVIEILEPIWTVKAETARRVRGRIEVVLDWARVRGYRTGENPARWRGHLQILLGGGARKRVVRHHAALPFEEMPRFMAELRTRDGTASRALEFAILTAARTSEVLGATKNEVDAATRTWAVPASRMKANKEHKVPLVARALAIAAAIQNNPGHYLFPSTKPGKSLSDMALLAVLKRMNRGDLTVHGFRSTFRDWAAERTDYPREVVEMALAHTIESKVEAAYRRGDLFEKRKRLMNDWEEFCGRALRDSNVVEFPNAKE
jgi:integrase